MDLRQLSYFVAIAEDGQFTRAAHRVSVAQPALSAQIRRLERELGETLFYRDRHGARLTEAGDALLPHARAALAAAARGRDTIASLRGMLHGRLRIGVAGPVDHRLAQTLGVFHRAHPEVEIVLTNHHNEPLLAAVAEGDVDVAVVGIGVQPLPPVVDARIVSVEPLVLCVARDHLLGRRKAVRIADLREHPMIALAPGAGLRAMLDSACRDAGFSPRITAETGDLGSLVQLAGEGLGLAVAPRSASAAADVAVVPIARPQLERRTALAWNRAGGSPAGRAFLGLAEEHVRTVNPR